jgi:hypothetical protein
MARSFYFVSSNAKIHFHLEARTAFPRLRGTGWLYQPTVKRNGVAPEAEVQTIFALLDAASERSERVDSGIATGACWAKTECGTGVPTNSGPMAKGYIGA